MIGSRMTAVGVGIWLFTTTGDTTPLLLIAFFNELPGMLGGSLAGVLIDRWDRRRILVLADAGQALGSLFLFLSLSLGWFAIWQLYAIALLQGIFAVFQQPAQAAVTTVLVDEAQRDRANGIYQMAFPLAGVVAPALAGIVFLSIGITGIIAVDMATFVVAVVAVLFIAIPAPPISEDSRAAQGHWLRELSAGFRYLLDRPGLLVFFILYTTLINFLLNGPLELAIPYLLLRTGSERLAGSLLGLMSLGALLGASLVAAAGTTRRKVRVMLLGYLFSGVMFLVYGATSIPWLLGASLLLLTVPLPVGGALSTSLLQSKVPADMQGRVFALLSQLALFGSTTSFLLTGWLVDHHLEPAVSMPGWSRWAPLVGSQPGAGIGLLLVITGLMMIAATILTYSSRAVREMETRLPDQNPH
jgi:MFS family permease